MKSIFLMLMAVAAAAVFAGESPRRVLELPNAPGNARNSEGDFVTLADGRILFIYTHYDGDSSRDAATAHLASRVSSDGGRTWSGRDELVVERGAALNVMSVSLLRLRDGRIALFYLQRNTPTEMLPVLRYSADEARSWSAPTVCLPPGREEYYILNNDRALLMRRGRIVLPLCIHSTDARGKKDMQGQLVCALSDDSGQTWRFGSEPFKTYAADGHRVTTQEPGVIELNDGRLMMWTRTCEGVQYVTYSSDGGETWLPAKPWNLYSPCSPAQVTRLKNGDLLAIWNDHAGHPELKYASSPSHAGYRTPFALAVSSDEGKTWQHRKLLEGSPWGWYCYPAVTEVEGAVVIGYCAINHLAWSRLARAPLDWLYGPDPDPQDPTTRLAAFPSDFCDDTLPPIVPAPRGYNLFDGWCDLDRVKVVEKAEASLPVSGYRIKANSDAVTIFASSPEGAFYARRTLALLRKGFQQGKVRCFRYFDAPRYAKRGVKLVGIAPDAKRDFRSLLDFMADVKLNILYCDPSPAERRTLESLARERFITLLPTAAAPAAAAPDAPIVVNALELTAELRLNILRGAERLWTAPPHFDAESFNRRRVAFLRCRDARRCGWILV